MTAGPVVSIGVPVHNGETFVRAALDALLAQEYRNFEIVISDNCSTDSTRAICLEYAERDPRVRVHTQLYNIGVFANFKVLIELARGRYFMWAAVDDSWAPGFVGSCVAELEQYPDAGVAMSAIDRIRENGEFLDRIRYGDVNTKTLVEMLRGITSPTKYNLFIYGLFRKEIIRDAMKFLPEVPGWDRLLVTQLALATRFRYVDEVLHTRLDHAAPPNLRIPDAAYNRMENEQRWVDAKVLIAFADMIFRSTLIPWHRKVYTPLILRRYGSMIIRARLVPRIKDRIAPAAWSRLKSLTNLF